MKRKALAFILLFLFFWAAPGQSRADVSSDNLIIREQTEEIIGEGARLISCTLSNRADDQPVKVFVLKLDLNNPYLELKSLIGADGTLAQRATVSQMVAGQKNAVAAVNGGFFVPLNGKPVGALIRDGELLASPNMRGDMPVFALDQKLKPVFDFFQFTGEVKALNGKTFPLFGVNKPAYNLKDGSLSDVNHLTLYNRYWGPKPRGADPAFPEAMVAMVKDGLVWEVLPAADAAGLDIPANGYALWGAGAAADFIRENLTKGQPVEVFYRTLPDYRQIKLATGSNSFLVKNGRVAEFEEELKGKTARTAVGYADEGKTLFFVAVEKSPQSYGLEQRDLAKFLVALGCSEALNLDGGGSTTLVARRLGDFHFSLINQPKEGRERKVPDAIGIFNTAPPGEPRGLLITGPDTVVAGVYAEYSVKGYDAHYHPWRPENLQWVFPAGTKVIEENIYKSVLIFEGEGPPEVSLLARAGKLTGTKTISVIRADDIEALLVSPAEISAQREQAIPLAFQIKTKDGRVIPIESRYVSCRTTIGTVKNGTYETGQQRGRGKLTASFHGHQVEVPVQVDCRFQDSAESWAFNQIEELAEAGIVKGFEDGTFRPAQPVTRAEMAALLARLLNWPPAPKQARFQDPLPEWANEAISAGVAQNVIRGYPDGTFKAHNWITRAELCAILDRALKLAPAGQKLNFKDSAQIPAWAKESITRVVARGLIRGYEDNTLRPKAYVTRAEMATVLWRYLNNPN